jgi:hypothetical protein
MAHPRDTASSAPASSGALPISRLVGSYYASQTDEVARIDQKGDSLTLGLVGRSLPLKATGPATYAVTSLPVSVEFVANGQAPARAMRLRVGSDLRAEAVRFTPVAPSEQELRALAGSYYSPELDVTWPIAFRDGHLTLANDATELVDISGVLEPAMADVFTAGSGLLRFTRDAAGRVTGYELSASRMRAIRFERRTP